MRNRFKIAMALCCVAVCGSCASLGVFKNVEKDYFYVNATYYNETNVSEWYYFTDSKISYYNHKEKQSEYTYKVEVESDILVSLYGVRDKASDLYLGMFSNGNKKIFYDGMKAFYLEEK